MEKRISLVLGGGGMRGYAHIGIIRELEKQGFQIKFIAGTSIGGIIGALYASGNSPDIIESIIDELDMRTLFRQEKEQEPSLLGLGGLFSLLRNKLGEKNFKELSVPFACTAVDMNSGCEIILDSGKVFDAVQATSAMPGIFPAKVIGDLYLVDGGIFDPVPVAVARSMRPDFPIVAVCLTPEIENWDNLPHLDIPRNTFIPPVLMDTVLQLRLGHALRIFLDSLDAMTNMVAELRLRIEKPDYIIRPEIKKYSMFSDAKPEELIILGEKAIKSNLDGLEKIFSTSYRFNRWFKSTKAPGKLLSQYKPARKSSSLKYRKQSHQDSEPQKNDNDQSHGNKPVG
jgi:NTE family protein